LKFREHLLNFKKRFLKIKGRFFANILQRRRNMKKNVILLTAFVVLFSAYGGNGKKVEVCECGDIDCECEGLECNDDCPSNIPADNAN
jgi:hypothetical protein